MTEQKTNCRIKKKCQEKRQKLKGDWINIRGLGTWKETEVKKKASKIKEERKELNRSYYYGRLDRDIK